MRHRANDAGRQDGGVTVKTQKAAFFTFPDLARLRLGSTLREVHLLGARFCVDRHETTWVKRTDGRRKGAGSMDLLTFGSRR